MSDRSAEERAVLDRVHDIARAYDARDLQSLLSFHRQGPETSLVSPDGARLTGWASIAEHLEMWMSEFQYSRTHIAQAEVFVRGDVAVATYERRIDSRLHDIEFTSVGWVTDVFVLQEGAWLRLHHHASEAKP